MGKVFITILMVIFMKDNGRMIKKMDEVSFIILQWMRLIKEILSIIKNMVKELMNFQMEIYIKDIFRITKEKGWESLFIQMDHMFKVNGNRIY